MAQKGGCTAVPVWGTLGGVGAPSPREGPQPSLTEPGQPAERPAACVLDASPSNPGPWLASLELIGLKSG